MSNSKILREYLFILEFEKFNKTFKNDKTKLFDVDWYVNTYSINDTNPILHYLKTGYKLGYDPNPYFSTEFYLKEYGDVKNSGINPFVHYLKYGVLGGRIPKLYDINEIPYSELESTLKGRNNYLFLINDSNRELDQHFNRDYENLFDEKLFLKQYKYKKRIFNELGIGYSYYIIPDKSIVCNEFLPISADLIKRNVDKLDVLNDFVEYLNPEDYFPCDTHMNYEGGKKLAFKILNHLDNTLDWKTFETIISNNFIQGTEKHFCDLLSDINWSYTPLEIEQYDNPIDVKFPIPKSLEDLTTDIPQQFKRDKNRQSEYYKNPKAVYDLKVLIFRDSSIRYVKHYFSFYFKEMFLCWDHGGMDKELIKWYKPDLILEVRIERFLENLPVASWVLNEEGI